MNKASEALMSIAAIGEAVDEAQENVMESMKTLGHKCDVMQEYHLNVGSADEVIQEFITNRDEIIAEYENNGPKKIYQRLLGMCNYTLPHFKAMLKGLEDETKTRWAADMWGGGWLNKFFGILIRNPMRGNANIDLLRMKILAKKTDKSSSKDAFSDEDRKIIRNLVDAAENWKTVSKFDRADRKFIDRFYVLARDTRTSTKITEATRKLVNALEATRDMARSHFGGDEPVQESSVDIDAGNGLLLKQKLMDRKPNSASSAPSSFGRKEQLKVSIKMCKNTIAEYEEDLRKAEAGEKTSVHPDQARSHIKFQKERLKELEAELAQIGG